MCRKGEVEMIYLIIEETTVYMMEVSTRQDIKGYYKCSSKEDVEEFCKVKTKELKGTYDDKKMDKVIIYKELNKLK